MVAAPPERGGGRSPGSRSPGGTGREGLNAAAVASSQGRGLFLLQFLTELTRLFQKCRTSGSVFITLKKCKF